MRRVRPPRPVPRQPVQLLIQAESGAYTRSSSRFQPAVASIYLNRHTPSGQSRVYRVAQSRIDGVHCREFAGIVPVVLMVVSVRSAAFPGITMNKSMCVRLSFLTPAIDVWWTCLIQKSSEARIEWFHGVARIHEMISVFRTGTCQDFSCLVDGMHRSNHTYIHTYDSFCITHVHYIPVVGVEKERRVKDWSTIKPEKAAPVTRTTLRTTGPVSAGLSPLE